MNEAILFLAVGIAAYFVSDRALDLIERRAGRRFEYRQVIFFAMLLGLILVSFAVLRRIFAA